MKTPEKNIKKDLHKPRKLESKEHELTNEEQWIHDVNEEFAEDIPPIDDDELAYDDDDEH